jgi:hypothetical protein
MQWYKRIEFGRHVFLGSAGQSGKDEREEKKGQKEKGKINE